MAAKKKSTERAKGSKKPRPAPQPVRAPEPPEESPPAPADVAPVQSEPERRDPPVAGIGASAGGLDAFKKLLAAMPPDSGIGLVLVPHLDPAHESLMVELLTRHTTMPVVEVEDDMPVEANHVYIIPPNKYMTIRGGILRLTGPVERRAAQTSIDLFLRSLADDRQERSICIILSGTGSHGALGLKAVKAAGGLAMVQDPATAEYTAMPQSAIATGLADYVLPVEQMPGAMVKYTQHYYVNGGKTGAEGEEAPDQLNQVLALVRARTKVDFRSYRKKMLARRVERRMSLNQFDRVADYLAFLREHPDEVQRLSRDLLISVTSFFRDSEAWHALETEVITPLVHANESNGPLRVWSVGCATGEEPYSLGMVLLEQLAAAQKSCPVQIFATDVDDDALQVARQAIYPENISADVSPERLTRFFTRVSDSSYQVSKQLRETVTFARQNLIGDAPFSKLDLIVCRNLLIYLEPEVQKKVIALLHFALNEGGFLFLGSSETIGRSIDLFEPISAKRRIYRRIGPARVNNLQFPVIEAEPRQVRTQPASRPQPPHRLAELAQTFLLRRFALACVVINRNYEILHFAGPTEDYLVQPGGAPTHGLLALARPGLETKLRVVIQRTIRQNTAQAVKNVMMRHGGVSRRVNINVEPLNQSKQTEGLLLISFQEQPNPVGESLAEANARTQTADSDMVRQLEQELDTTREDLQSTIEELESSNEELKASNEEVMSMNEELQSANEELETSKEELQSLNEEMTTVNNQLHEKVQELESTNNDMANLFNCTEIATVFLDPGLCIKRFTPATTRLLKLIPTDVGRPLGDIVKKFTDDDLLGDAQRLLQDPTPREKEVPTEDGRWCARRIVPYRTLNNRIDGVVITFVDITERKQAADAVARRLAAIVESSADAIYSKDLDGTVRTWNAGAERLYGFTANEVVGRSIRLTIPEDRVEEWTHAMARLARGELVEQMESERVSKDGRRFPVVATFSPLANSTGTIVGVSAITRDITERKRAELALRASEKHLAEDLVRMTRLHAVSTKLVQTGEAASLLLEIVDAAIAIAAADMGNIQMFDRGRGPGALKIVAQRGFEKPFLEYFNAVQHGHAACGTALQSGQRVVVEDVATSPVFVGTPALDVLLGAGVRAVVSTPLFSRSGQIVGMLSTHYRRLCRPAEQELKAIDLLARQAADWIERTQHERELQLQGQVVANLAEGVSLVRARDATVLYTNDRFEQMFGYGSGDLPGKHVSVLNGGSERERNETADRIIRTLREKGMWQGEVLNSKEDGTPLWTHANVSTFEHDDHGTVWISAQSDITERKRAEEALRDREERLRAILETAADAIITIDNRGIIQSVNRATERMFGYAAAEMLDQNVSMLMSSPYHEAHDGYMARYAQTKEKHIIGISREVDARRKDGSVFPTDLAVSEIEHLGLFTGIHRDLTERKQLEREVVEAASLEQRRIGRDLHDSVAQELTALNLLAGDLVDALRTNPASASQLAARITQGLQRSQLELRAVLRGLLPVAVDGEGLMAALADLAARTHQEGKVSCRFDCPESVVLADNLPATHLYLIAQEAVRNAVKHARSRNVHITLESNHRLVLRVTDDGIGMPVRETENPGLGLRIMRNRAAIIGAALTIEPGKPTGTRVTCSLARRNDEQE